MSPTVSATVGVPFTNQCPEHFREAVRSVFAQSTTAWRLVLIGDAPSPALLRMATQITDPRVEVIHQEERQGLARTLNHLARRCQTEYLVRMDADDVMHPLRLEIQLGVLQGPDRPDVVGSRAFVIDEESRLLGAYVERPHLPLNQSGYLRSNALTHPTVAGRTAWFRRYPYDERLLRSEDKDLWLRAAHLSKIQKINDRTLFYRIPPMSPAKQSRDSTYDRSIIREHAPALVGPHRTALLLGRSRVKQAVFRAVVAAGAGELVRRRKIIALSPGDRSHAAHVLDQAIAADVPGWPCVNRESGRS